MKKLLFVIVMGLIGGLALNGQSMKKKAIVIEVERELPFPAEKVWATVADDYGNIANSHPKIMASKYAKGSLKGEKGAQRLCYFNTSETRSLYEEIVEWNPTEGYFINRVLEAKRFPIDEDNTRAIYQIKSAGANKSIIAMKMEFRTKPAFMGGMAKGQFKKLLLDYFIAIEHHLTTGESVTAANFKDIRKQYSRT